MTSTQMAHALTPNELKTMYKNATANELNIIMLQDVHPTETLDGLFKLQNHFVLYIPTLSEMNGHYVSFFRNTNGANRGIYFLDSYGNTPKRLYNIIQQISDIKENPALFDIMAASGEKYYCNTVDYQTMSSLVSDCGRYAVSNCVFHFINGDKYNLKQYDLILKRYMNENGVQDYDIAITQITEEWR